MTTGAADLAMVRGEEPLVNQNLFVQLQRSYGAASALARIFGGSLRLRQGFGDRFELFRVSVTAYTMGGRCWKRYGKEKYQNKKKNGSRILHYFPPQRNDASKYMPTS